MTEPSNFRLKNGRTIIIDNKDVQRIRILNDIVWEKTKNTSTSITATPNSVTPGKTFNLIATVSDSNGVGVNGTITFSGNGIEDNNTIQVSNGVATLQNISTTNIGENTYTAYFQGNDTYLESQGSTTITVDKETPILTIVGEATIYDTWKIGVKLTASDGKTPLANQSIKLTIGGSTYTLTTNSKGIASRQITDLTGTKTATFTYNGDTTYNSKSISKQYTIKSSLSKTLEYDTAYANSNGDIGTKDSVAHTQLWKQNSSKSYQCYKSGVSCWSTTSTIGTSAGTYNTPDLLKIRFKKGDIKQIQSATLTFTSQQKVACSSSHFGGCFGAPTIKLSTNNSTYTKGSGAKAFPTEKHGGYTYSTQNSFAQTITWGEKTVSSNPIVTIQYPSNTGAEEAILKITNLSLKVAYIPTQATKFS